jgi:uncharacterized membrane protein YeaQ/YmgE (transglycosylase-associated protein family)
MEILWFILIGICAGWLAGLIVKGRGLGLIADLIVGVIGSLIGGFLFAHLGIFASGTIGTLLTATAGAVILLVILKLLTGRPTSV